MNITTNSSFNPSAIPNLELWINSKDFSGNWQIRPDYRVLEGGINPFGNYEKIEDYLRLYRLFNFDAFAEISFYTITDPIFPSTPSGSYNFWARFTDFTQQDGNDGELVYNFGWGATDLRVSPTDFNFGSLSYTFDSTELTNKWALLTVTGGPSSQKIYINGTLRASNTDTPNFGNMFDMDIFTAIDGYLSDFFYYSRALSDTEIQFLYSTGIKKLYEI